MFDMLDSYSRCGQTLRCCIWAGGVQDDIYVWAVQEIDVVVTIARSEDHSTLAG